MQAETSITRSPLFWVATGILVYFTGNLFIEGLLNYLMERSMELARHAYEMSFVFTYLFFIMLTVAAWLSPNGKGTERMSQA